MTRTLVDKIWDAHFVARRDDGRDVVYVDRHVLHERTVRTRATAPHLQMLERQP